MNKYAVNFTYAIGSTSSEIPEVDKVANADDGTA